MTEAEFRALAVALPEATEGAHQGHADFRLGGKVFATLGHPGPGWAVVKLAAEQQAMRLAVAPEAFEPVPGAWGARGWTRIRLEAAERDGVAAALREAWAGVAPKRLLSR